MSQSDFVTRGQALVSSGQYQEAVKVCRLGLLGRPTTVEGRIVLGQALLALKRYDEVLAEMRVALELDHASQAAQALKGEALLRKGDGHGAAEVLGRLRSQGLADAHVAGLLAEAERLASRAPPGGQNTALGYAPTEQPSLEPGTKNYLVDVGQDVEDETDNDYGRPGEFTRPTALAAPSARKRRGHDDDTPPPALLAVGDRSEMSEVDDASTMHRSSIDDASTLGRRSIDHQFDSRFDNDFDDDAAGFSDPDAVATGVRPSRRRLPGPSRPPGPMAGMRPAPAMQTIPAASPPAPRGSVAPAASRKARGAPARKEEDTSSVELSDSEVIELEDPRLQAPRGAQVVQAGAPARDRGKRGLPGPSMSVRDAVKMPSGPIDLPSPPPPGPQLAQLIASQPHVMNVAPAQPLPPAASNPRSAIASALPTAAALPMPAPPVQQPVSPRPLPAMPAMAFPAAPATPMSPGAMIAPAPAAPPAHMAPTMMVHAPVMAASPSSFAASRPTLAISPSQPIPPAETGFNGMAESDVVAVAVGQGSGDAVAAGFGEPTGTRSKSRRTGRKARSKLQVVVWVLISVAVIGGGVFAGFQIRAIRLRHQIAAARDRAGDLAKADTWQGWIDARDALFSIAQASSTADNRAAFARARGVLAFEFGDGVADARRIVDGLAGQSGADLPLAAAYVALAQRDGKAARDAAERALQDAPGDAAALYVSGQAAALAGDLKAALVALRGAVDREPRPAYLIGLARALGDATAWDEALAALDKAGNGPGAVIARGVVLAGGGRVIGGPGGEIRAQLAKLVADGQKPADKPGDRPADVSPAQVAFADLALARVDFARGEPVAAQADARASLGLGIEDPRFAEELCDTLLAIGDVETARKAVAHTLEHWPTSRRARISLAEVDLAIGKPADALDALKVADAAAGTAGQTVRGKARLASGDVDGARADFDAVLKKQPDFEPALIARAGLDLAAGDIDAARKRIERKLHPKTPTAGMAAIYAAILRATGEPEARDKAKALLERVVVGSRGPDTPRAQLELARIDRDLGDMGGARANYLEAARAGNPDARLESATLLIDNRDPRGGHDALEQLLKDAGEHAGAALLLEAARGRALVGDHNGAFDLLARADKAPGVVRWQLDRERGRIALRKGDTAGAARSLVRALDACGADLDTYLLAADTVAADDRQTELAGRLKAAVPARLKGKPEADIIAGKLAIAANQFDEADKAYAAAHDALLREKAAPRRLAQCNFGIAATAYFRREDAKASSLLRLVLADDASIDQAYLFAAELDRARDPDKALDTARLAVAYNPDSVEGWRMVGTIAAQLPKQRKLLDEAISRINDLAPTSDALHQLQRLK